MRNPNTVIILAVVCQSFLSCSTQAGTISMSVESHYDAAGSNLFVNIENKGDEAAQNVTVSVEYMGETAQSPAIRKLEPLLPRLLEFPIGVEELTGTRPVIITVAFEDLNGYPFSSVTINQLRSGNAPSSPLRVALANTTIHGHGAVKAKIFNDAPRTVNAKYRLLIPRELLSTNVTGTIKIAPKQKQRLELHLENFSAITGATYPIHFLLEHDERGIHYIAPGVSIVTIDEKPPPVVRVKKMLP